MKHYEQAMFWKEVFQFFAILGLAALLYFTASGVQFCLKEGCQSLFAPFTASMKIAIPLFSPATFFYLIYKRYLYLYKSNQ